MLVFVGTTISIILTLGSAFLMEKHGQKQDRRLSAMMVMSNIEKFSRNLEEVADYMTSNDSVATWLLDKPIEDLELLPEEELDYLVSEVTDLLFLTYDKSAENIFPTTSRLGRTWET